MSVVRVDREKCQGYGNCVLHADSHFDLDEDGFVVLTQQHVEASDLEAVKRAVYDCPAGAIAVDEA